MSLALCLARVRSSDLLELVRDGDNDGPTKSTETPMWDGIAALISSVRDQDWLGKEICAGDAVGANKEDCVGFKKAGVLLI